MDDRASKIDISEGYTMSLIKTNLNPKFAIGDITLSLESGVVTLEQKDNDSDKSDVVMLHLKAIPTLIEELQKLNGNSTIQKFI